MILLALHKIAKEFPNGLVFSDISWENKSSDKIGLLGVNGVGKTTLLRIMSGDLHPDSGTVTLGRGVKIGRLRQIPDRRLTEKLFDYVAEGRQDILNINRGSATRTIYLGFIIHLQYFDLFYLSK